MGPTTAYINHNNLRHNISLIRKAVGTRKIMAVVKANAYGHGDVEVSRTALEAGCEYLGVAFIEEGIKLRKAGISAPILVFGAQIPEYLAPIIDYDLEMTITSHQQLEYIEKTIGKKNKKIPIHLKVDTGMNRVGFLYNKFPDDLRQVLKNSSVEIKCVYSHLSTADEEDHSYFKKQIARFREIEDLVKSKVNNSVQFHLANSAAIINLPEAYFDIVRPGIMLYGQPPSPQFDHNWNLKEVLTLRSKIALIKYVKKNEPISYSRRFYTKEDTFIAVVPAGYADGINRRLINNMDVLINGKKFPAVGTVCMDMIMIDLGQNHNCSVGDEVVLYGQSGNEHISIRQISEKLHTIPYEITCNVSARVPREHLYF